MITGMIAAELIQGQIIMVRDTERSWWQAMTSYRVPTCEHANLERDDGLVGATCTRTGIGIK